MSEVLEHETQDTETAERPFLVREFASEIVVADGRTVDVRVVPYGERIAHNDGLGDVPKGVVYQEEWAPGAFAHQVNAANRVVANYEHEQGIGGIVGHGLALREERDGLHGSFKIHQTDRGDAALEMIREGVLSGVSLEAIPRKAVKTRAGVVRRTKADLRAVAFTRFHAYASAKVLAVREEAEMVDEALLPVDLDPELIERCRRLGIALPQRYQAHPAATDTPEESGTSDAAPAEPANTDSEE